MRLQIHEVPAYRVLFRGDQQPLTESEWIELVVGRQQTIAHHLEFMALPTLRGTACVETASSRISGLDDYGTYFKDHDVPNPRGIFRLQPWNTIERIPNSGYRKASSGGISVPDAIKRIWGLTEANKWLVATVRVKGVPSSEWNVGREELESVEVSEGVALQEMLQATSVSPREVWKELGSQVERTEDHYTRLLARAQHLAAIVREDARVIEARSRCI